jgi:hypothetical protein
MRQAMQRYGRQPLRAVSQQRVSIGRAIPAPVGGWDAQSPLANMPPENAVILDNFIPRAGYVELRKGFVPWQEGLTLPVETIMVWRGGVASLADDIFAASGGSIFDVSNQSEAPVEVFTGAGNARWQWINFANDAGTFLIAANGTSAPIFYNGSVFNTTAISGTAGVITLDPRTLVDVMDHKGRLFFVQEDSLRVWFLDPFAIQGQAFLLDLGPIFDKGGAILCQATWTLDGGSGADDLAVFVTTQGQVAVYQGLDPSDANNWALVGVYDLGLPLSRRSLIKYGSDLVLLTTDGVVPLSQALSLDRAQENLVALTQKIQNAFQQATTRYRGNFGWEGTLYPKGTLAIFNVPTANLTRSEQYVQNVQTGAWCRFTGINAFCWAVANDQMYFGTADSVCLWDTGFADNTEGIVGDIKTAFNYFGSRGSLKKFEMLQPVLRISTGLAPAVEIVTDFKEKVPTAVPTTIATTGGKWDVGLWDVAKWSPATETRDSWTSVTGIGYCGAVRLRVQPTPTLFTDLGVELGDTDVVSYDGVGIVSLQAARNTNAPCEIVAFNVKYQNQTGGQL